MTKIRPPYVFQNPATGRYLAIAVFLDKPSGIAERCEREGEFAGDVGDDLVLRADSLAGTKCIVFS